MKQVQGEKRKMSANDFIQKDYSDYFKLSIFIALNYTNHFSTYFTDCFTYLFLLILLWCRQTYISKNELQQRKWLHRLSSTVSRPKRCT